MVRRALISVACLLMALAVGQFGFAQECKDGTCVLRAIASKVVESPVVHAVQSVVGHLDHSTRYHINEVDMNSVRCDAQPVCAVQPVQRPVVHAVAMPLCILAQKPIVRVAALGCYPCWPQRVRRCFRR